MLRLAQTILKAQKLREDSYSYEDGKKTKGVANYIQYYKKSIPDVSEEAVINSGIDLKAIELISFLLQNNWNDIQVWAQGIVNYD